MRKISTIYKILIMFMIVFWLENNYITYKTIADVGYSGSVAEKMDKYVDENILNKMTEEQKESLVWDWEEYKITGYPSGYDSKYQDYYDDYINAFNSELLNLGGEGYTSLEKAIVTAKNAGRTKSFDNEQNKALDSGKEVPNVTSSTNSSSSTSTTEGQGSRATTLDDIIKNGKSFLQLGDISVANEDELKLMIRLIQPKYLMPFHGDYRMLKRHANIGIECGIPKENTFVLKNGDSLSLVDHKITRSESMPGDDIYVDGNRIGEIGSAVLKDRQMMARDGILVVIINVDMKKHELLIKPNITTRGFILINENEDLLKKIEEKANSILKKELSDKRSTFASIKSNLTNELYTYIVKLTGRNPIILPIIIDIKREVKAEAK